jgi:hypothetical protein
MTATKGFFSVIQFCPDLDRGECANVGVVLAVPPLGFIDVRLGEDNEGPKQRFGVAAYDDARLTVSKKGLEGRLRHDGKEWNGPDDLQRFARREGNNLLLTTPRVIMVEQASEELDELYQRLVHVDPSQRRPTPRKPDLKTVFEPKLWDIPLIRDLKVPIPEYGKMNVPYAYQNGLLNLIRPEGFPIDEGSATAKANDLAVKGHLIFRHPGESGKPQKLIVVGGFDASASEDLKRRIDFVLSEHDARLVREDRIDDFIDEVRREAHA